MQPDSTTSQRRSGGSPALLFVAAAVWILVALATGRAAAVFVPTGWYDLVRQGVDAAMLFGGFYLIARSSITDMRPLSSVGLVRRPSASREFGLGLALGWGIAIALVLPGLLTGNLHASIALDGPSLLRFLLSLLTLVGFAAAVQLVLSGLPMRLLVRSTRQGWAVAAAILVAVLVAAQAGPSAGRGVLFVGLAAGLFLIGFLRTRALWLSLGLQIGWTVVLQLLFGAPSAYTPVAGGVVQSTVAGPDWLTGGAYGPETSLWAVLCLIAALVVLFRITRDYAWHYTYQPIEAAGYPMDVAPPAAHLKEEQKAAAAAPLVQIGGIQKPPADPLTQR